MRIMRTASVDVSLLALSLLAAPSIISPAAAQSVTFAITGEAVVGASGVGHAYAIVSEPPSRTGDLRVAIDAGTFAEHKFPIAMQPVDYIGRPCPHGSQCFYGEFRRDLFSSSGRHSMGLRSTPPAA